MRFPENVKVISWNYDFQLELASEYFSNENFVLSGSGTSVHSPPLANYFPPIGSHFGSDFIETSIVHLNGIAGSFLNEKQGPGRIRSINEQPNDKDLTSILAILSSDEFNSGNLLWFAWEKNQIIEKSISYAEKIAAETDILVVIGYSFPFFNREIDNKIFEKLKSSGKLKKIYFQDPFNDGKFLKNQFSIEEDIVISPYMSDGNYIIPLEL